MSLHPQESDRSYFNQLEASVGIRLSVGGSDERGVKSHFKQMFQIEQLPFLSLLGCLDFHLFGFL